MTGTRFIKVYGLIYEQGLMYVPVGMIILFLSCASWTWTSLYSASPLKHHVAGMQWCPNPDHYPDSKLASRSLNNSYVLSTKQSSRTSNLNIFFFFGLTWSWIEPPTSRMPGKCWTTTLPGHGHEKDENKASSYRSYSSKNLISIKRLKQNVLPGYNVKCWKSSFLMWTIDVDSWYSQLI